MCHPTRPVQRYPLKLRICQNKGETLGNGSPENLFAGPIALAVWHVLASGAENLQVREPTPPVSKRRWLRVAERHRSQ
jgi:hypothetical protein